MSATVLGSAVERKFRSSVLGDARAVGQRLQDSPARSFFRRFVETLPETVR